MTWEDNVLDPALADLLGPTGAEAAAAIGGICRDALETVLGPERAREVVADPALLPRIAPWVRDLARGLQYQDRHGPEEPRTTELLALLSGGALSRARLEVFAESVDLSVMLTLGRVAEQVLGSGATGRDPLVNDVTAPWLAGLKLGYRIGLAMELLRLLAP